MTLISAVISKYGISVASDSILVTTNKNSTFSYWEWRKPKIIAIPKLHACVSYWGFAGVQLSNSKKHPKWGWKTNEWLKMQCINPKYTTLEDFVKYLAEELNNEFNNIKEIPRNNKGIGMHITGIEKIEDYYIPELFLISNYMDTTYQNIKDLDYSRETYHTISREDSHLDHRKKEYRLAVNKYFNDGEILIYNNGDTRMFNAATNVIRDFIKISNQRGNFKKIESLEDTIPIAKRPIEIACGLQKDFLIDNTWTAGGRIHDYSIRKDGTCFSSSGVK